MFKHVESISRFPALVTLVYLLLPGCGGGDNGRGASSANTSTELKSSPTAEIYSPSFPKAILPGETLLLSGAATDSEDGDLTDSSLIWSSDIDGELGTGENLSISTLSLGSHVLSLTATDSDGQSDTNIANARVLSPQAVLESLYLGTGPLQPQVSGAHCPYPGRISGFLPGTQIEVVISDTVTTDQRQYIASNLDLVYEYTGGQITTFISTTNAVDPLPLMNQVSVTVGTPPASLGCTPSGCTILQFDTPGLIRSARIIMPSSQTAMAFAHDTIGHGILGLCHIDGNQLGDPVNSLMSFGENIFSTDISPLLTNLDSYAVSSLYTAAILPGSQRHALEDVGLLAPVNNHRLIDANTNTREGLDFLDDNSTPFYRVITHSP